MSEAPEQRPDTVPMDEDDPDWFMTTVVGVAGCLIVVACVYMVSALYYGVDDNLEEKLVVSAEHMDLAEYRAKQAERLKNIDQLKDEWLRSQK